MQKVIKIKNLDCAGCAAELSEELQGIAGVEKAVADFINQRVTLEYSSDEALEKAIYTISHFEEVEIVDENAPEKKESRLKEILSIAISAAFFVPALVLDILGINEWVVFGLFLASFAAAGWSVVWNVFRFRGFKNILDENLLMTIAAIGAFALRQGMEGAAVMLLYQIGELLQSLAVGSSRGAITRLAQLKSDSAIRLTGDEQTEVSPEELAVGDVVLIRKGDKVPTDCTLLEGETSLDTKSLTGEAYYREAVVGDELLAGFVNVGNAVKAEVVRPASESAVAKILELVEGASANKAKPEKFITKFARIYTPVVVLLALFLAVIPPLFQSYNFATWIVRALNFLVISCPCALIISVPLTYFSGVGALAREGVLVKGAAYLDLLARVKTAAFDKTGTLTEGKFTVGKTHGDMRALSLAASLEHKSAHPLARAFADIDAPEAEDVEELSGLGISGMVGGKVIIAGNLRLMQERGIDVPEVQTASLVVYVAEDGKYLGAVEIEDRLRPEAEAALNALKKAGVEQIAVLTGDTKTRAEACLKTLPVDAVQAELMPEQKPERARELRQDGLLLYVGDGINDTPVMAESDISVAMGGLGSDAAIEASDLVLATDSLTALPKAMRGAKKTRRIVMQNIVFSIAVKVALMVLSVFGFIPLWAAILGDVGVMLLAVLNSMRMRAKIK